MADEEKVKRLKNDIELWNVYREAVPQETPDLTNASLIGGTSKNSLI